MNKCLPDAIAAFIAWLVNESSWGFRARDIAVLFRRRTQAGSDLTREYARALEARGLPHLLAGSKSFHRREEVETLRAGLAAIEWPDDELSVFATLKGSLFAIRDEVLLRYRHERGRVASVSQAATSRRMRISRRWTKRWRCWRNCIARAIAARSQPP